MPATSLHPSNTNETHPIKPEVTTHNSSATVYTGASAPATRLRRSPAPPNGGAVTRRNFLRTLGIAAGATFLAPSLLQLGGCNDNGVRVRKPGEKLRLAGIGVGGRGKDNLRFMTETGETIAALCDVDANNLAAAATQIATPFPTVARYRDWRELLAREQDLDGVFISTPDHMHAPIALAAIARGLHVYCEKPLTRTIREARTLRQAAAKPGIVTQMGNHGSANANMRRGIEAIRAGVIGPIREVHAWTNRPDPYWPQGIERPAGEDTVPEHLDWDLWLGVAPQRPFKAGVYHQLKWRGFHDFGTGAFGDMGCHTLNLAYHALDIGDPVEATCTDSSDRMPETFAKRSTVRFRFGERHGLAPMTLWWSDGGNLPPADALPACVRARGKLPIAGNIIIGDGGVIFSDGDYNDSLYLALKGEDRLRSLFTHAAVKDLPATLPRARKGHHQEWVDACRGQVATFAPFAHAARLAETCSIGSIAQRMPGTVLAWDAANACFPGHPAATAMVDPPYRSGWTS